MTSLPSIVLLACGSFNPITDMHLRLFEVARDALNSSGMYHVIGGIISPVNDRYNKADLIPASHRCKMVDLALKTSDWIRCDRWESLQECWQETVKVLRHHQATFNKLINQNIPSNTKKQKLDLMNIANISSKLPSNCTKVIVKLLCGADLLQSFAVPGLWKENDIVEIVSKYGMVVITREGSNPLRFIYESDILTQYKNNIFIVTEWIPNDVSSTSIRRALRRGESVKYLMQDEVIQYISEHGLYNSQDNKYSVFHSRSRRICNFQPPLNIPCKIPEADDYSEQETAVSPRMREVTRKSKVKHSIKTFSVRKSRAPSSRARNVRQRHRKGR